MSKILRSVYRMMKDLHDIGLVTNERMKEFEERCLPKPKRPVPITPALKAHIETLTGPTEEIDIDLDKPIPDDEPPEA